MENQNTSPAVPQSLPWYDDRVKAVRRDAATLVGRAVDGLELRFDFDDCQRFTNIRFMGLDGAERVTVKQALGLMEVRNPVATFRDNINCLAYEHVTPEEFQGMLNTVKLIDSMWRYKDEPGEAPTMNALMLLANAIELVSKLYAELQDRSGKT